MMIDEAELRRTVAQAVPHCTAQHCGAVWCVRFCTLCLHVMSSETPPDASMDAFAGAALHRIARGYILAFPCSYTGEAKLELKHSGVSASHLCGAFKHIGFDSAIHSDLDAKAMTETVTAAAQALRSFDVLVLYFCGHGFAEGTTQFLVAEDGTHVDQASICAVVSEAVTDRELSNVALILLLDCCRDEGETLQRIAARNRAEAAERASITCAGETRLTPGLAERHCPGGKRGVEAMAHNKQGAVRAVTAHNAL